MNALRLIMVMVLALLVSGCATFNKTEIDTGILNGINTGCVSKSIHDDSVMNTGIELDDCILKGRYQAVLVEVPEKFWTDMFRYTTAGHHGAAFANGKAYRVQWMWAGVTGDGSYIPFKIRLWAIIEGMDTFDPQAHAVIMDARGNNAYDLYGDEISEFSGKDYREGKWAKLAMLGESTRLGNAVAMFDGPHLDQLKEQIREYTTLGRVDFKDPHTKELFSIATPFNMTILSMREKMKELASINTQYSLMDHWNAAIKNFSISPSPYGMALSAAFTAWDFVTMEEVKPNSVDAIGVVKRINNELERFTAKFAKRSE